jgi:hypothetical protein
LFQTPNNIKTVTYENAENNTRKKCRNGKAALLQNVETVFGQIGQTIENVVNST